MANFYTSLEDMPIYNWFKVNSGKLEFVYEKKPKKIDEKEAEKAFESLFAEYIDIFGISESYYKVLELKKEICKLNIEMALTGDLFLKNFIRMAQIELNDLNKNTDKTNLHEVKVYLEKYLGFRLNEKEVSVKEYYTYLNVMSKDNKKAA